MNYNDMVSRAAEELNITPKEVDTIYRAYWKSVRAVIEEVPLESGMTDEEFLKLQPNMNIPSLGKLNVTLDKYHKTQIRLKYYKQYTEQQNAAHTED